MNTGYMIFQAERTRSAAEQREIDRVHGELAEAVARRWHRIGAALVVGLRSVSGAGGWEQLPGRRIEEAQVGILHFL